MKKKIIRQGYRNAQKKWPQLSVDYECFAERIVFPKGVKPEKMAFEDLFLAIELEKGTPAALECFYRTYGDFIRRVSLRIVKKEDRADDILQEIISLLPRRIKSYQGDGSLFGWLSFVIRNFCIDYLRKEKKYSPSESFTLEAEPAPDERLPPDVLDCNEYIADLLTQAVAELPADRRLMMECRFIDGLKNREIAASVLKTAEYNVSRWVKKALVNIRKLMKKLACLSGPGGLDRMYNCLELLKDHPKYLDLSAAFRSSSEKPAKK